MNQFQATSLEIIRKYKESKFFSVKIYEQAKRPIILAGNGVIFSGSVDKLREKLAVSAVKNKDGSMTSKPIEDMYPFLQRSEFLDEMIIKPI